jgi:hypothetical protein
MCNRFSALTMKSVGQAANAMVKEVARQWAEIPVRNTAIIFFVGGIHTVDVSTATCKIIDTGATLKVCPGKKY